MFKLTNCPDHIDGMCSTDRICEYKRRFGSSVNFHKDGTNHTIYGTCDPSRKIIYYRVK